MSKGNRHGAPQLSNSFIGMGPEQIIRERFMNRRGSINAAPRSLAVFGMIAMPAPLHFSKNGFFYAFVFFFVGVCWLGMTMQRCVFVPSIDRGAHDDDARADLFVTLPQTGLPRHPCILWVAINIPSAMVATWFF
jgi:hypothetical protein